MQNIKVYESMCTPYIKAELTVIDNKGLIAALADKLGTLAGEVVKFSFFDGEQNYTRNEQRVLTVDSQPSESNKRVQVYQIGTIGVSYMNDRKSMVQKGTINMTATAAASMIHNEFLGGDAGLKVIASSLGPIAQDKSGSFNLSNVKPFKAIDDILKRAAYGRSANPTVYFRNNKGYVLGPLEDIFRQTSATTTITESATWGKTLYDMFEGAHYSIIAAGVIVEKDDINNKRSKLHSLAASAYQGNHIFNMASNDIELDKNAAAAGFAVIGGLAGMSASKLGGMPNAMLFNPLRAPLATTPEMFRPQENIFLAKVATATKYLIRVPIRAGLKCTAGEGVNAKILAPAGDSYSGKTVGGLLLVADIMHDCYFDKRESQATSTMRAVSVKEVL